MKTYAYTLRVTKSDGIPRIQHGQVGCENFHTAVKLSLDTESMPWDEKRATRELVSLVRIDQLLL